MFDTVEKRALKTARRAAFAGLAGVLISVGTGFFTVALFLFLLTQMSALQACLLLGAGFVGLGLIVAGLTRAKAQEAEARRGQEPQAGAVLQAFFTGVQQGMATRRSGSDGRY